MPPSTTTPGRTAAPKRKRGEGQWKLGHREPLNPNERTKKDDDGLNVRARIENVYSKRGFDSIDPADLRGRMRWWGLYTQRRPGIDGGRTAVLEPEELDDSYFMLRVRLDGGALTTEQLRALGEISQTYARDTADVTDRQNIQYHWIEIESMPAIWQRLESLGMITTEACGDTPRVILGSPVAGIAANEEIDPQPAIDTILERYIGNKAFSNLPRKFKTAISWQQDVAHEVNDISFIGAVHPEHGPGFDLWVGGGLSTNPKIAQRLGVWVPLDEVPDVWEGVISIFRDYGYRRLRHRARIKFLVADWGVEKFRQVLEDEYLHRKLVDGPAPATPERPIDHVGVHKQRDGLNYVGLQAEPSVWRRSTMACTGIEFCKLAIVETKERAIRLVEELEKRLADVHPDVPISIHLNGCPNACARTQVADIGLKGMIVTDADGNQVEGFQVHLGGGLGLDAGFGRKLRGLKVTSAELGDYVDRLVRRFVEQREPDERFAQWVVRAAEDDLK
jgi:sulfite reductase (ferredoxin)